MGKDFATRAADSLRDLMIAPPWQWALQVPSVQALGPVSRLQRNFVAYTPLLLPTQCWDYVASLHYDHDFVHLPAPASQEVTRRKGLSGNAAGWQRNPHRSGEARAAFEDICQRFFPPTPPARELARSLSGVASEYAAAIGAHDLRIKFTCMGRGHSRPGLGIHKDAPDQLSAGGYLKESATIQQAPPWNFALQRVSPDDLMPASYGSSLQPLRRYRSVPERSLSMWPENQPHAIPYKVQDTRIGFFMHVLRGFRTKTHLMGPPA